MLTYQSSSLDLKKPLTARGRPRKSRLNCSINRTQTAYGHSNLDILYRMEKITVDQYNAGETFLWIMQEIRRNLPLPRLSQNKYQEKVSSVFVEMGVDNESHLRNIFQKWHQSIYTLKSIGRLTKDLLEDFVWSHEQKIDKLSVVELQLIKRGLDALAHLYQAKN